MTNVWDERAATWEDQPESHTYAKQALATLEPVVETHLGAWKDLRVLDFGAGTGLLTERLAPLCREVVALDPSPRMIEVLDNKVAHEKWENVATIAGYFEHESGARPELREPFDLIVASSVCSFLPDFPAELSRLGAVLRPGGLFVQWDWLADTAGDWASGLSRDDIEAAYKHASLEVISAGPGFVFSFDGKELDVLQAVGRAQPATP